ncbi:MAG: spherulation-specific family 4 protein [Deltaproteobacteria bacterium]|nr:spherulation-specific family 4 protein [Deltaproteobacteria bacterium]
MWSLLPIDAGAAFTQSVAVPAYFYPGTTWDQLESGAPTVGFAVMDPDNGPGVFQDPFYVSQIAATQAAGIRIYGYVDTAYATRAVAAVQADVDLYYLWYGVDGIFFDQASNDCADEPYYENLDAYVKGKDAAAVTVINPGTTTPECFINAADIILNFEDTYAAYQGWSPAGWEAGYPADRFWHLVHTTAEIDMPGAVLLSQQRGAGWIYVTGDAMANPWDTLPSQSYWATELAYVRPSGACATPVARPKLVLGHVDTPQADDTVAFSGRATLAGAPALDPTGTGVRLVLEDAGGVISDVEIPAGAYVDPPAAGWKVSANGKTWRYIDRSGSAPGGISKLVVKDRSSQAPGLLLFSIKGRDGSYPATPANLPLHAVLLLDATAPDGPCALADFSGSAPTCAFSSSGSSLKCR